MEYTINSNLLLQWEDLNHEHLLFVCTNLLVTIVVNLYLTRVILSEYLEVYLLSIGTLIKLIYKYNNS